MQALSKAKVGGNYTIQWLFGLPEVVEFLHRHHVEEGSNNNNLLYSKGSKDQDKAYGKEVYESGKDVQDWQQELRIQICKE